MLEVDHARQLLAECNMPEAACQLDALLVEIDDGLRGHQPLTDDDGVALALQQLVQTGAGAVLQGVAILD